MFVYSKKIVQFIHEIKCTIKDILSKEACLKVSKDRFFDEWQQFSYPISVIIYNDQSMLGYFDPAFYEMGFHERLMHASTKQLHNVIRHELAHYLTFINYAYPVAAHGAEFRSLCQKMGWGEEVYHATMKLSDEQTNANMEESDIFRKIQKLIALSSSSNKNEAELAMIKSQQLLLKHHIESKYMGVDDEEKVFLKRIMKQPQKNAKMYAIAKILEAFFVSIVFRRGKDGTTLEILGSAINIQIVGYVADVLQHTLDDLWELAKHEYKLKGLVAKNSFFLGISKGYLNKIDSLKKSYNNDAISALVIIEKKLQQAKAMAYGRLSSSTSQATHCSQSAKLGELAGKQLNINPGINRSPKHSNELISHNSGS